MSNEKDAILLIIAEGDTHDSEYAGRMYTYCTYCGRNQEHDKQHDDGCLMIRARAVLGSVWTGKLEREQREREQAELREQQEWERESKRRQRAAEKQREQSRANCVPCPHCGAKIPEPALEHHQRHSHKCLKAQGKMVPTKPVPATIRPRNVVAKVLTNVTTNQGKRVCPQCGVSMVGAHPNKKFCSNTGAGNCKDAFHNTNNPRGIGSILQAAREARREMLDAECEDDDFEHGHIFASGFDGHGQE